MTRMHATRPPDLPLAGTLRGSGVLQWRFTCGAASSDKETECAECRSKHRLQARLAVGGFGRCE